MSRKNGSKFTLEAAVRSDINCIVLVREMLFISRKIQGTLKIDVCGNDIQVQVCGRYICQLFFSKIMREIFGLHRT